MKRFHIHIAVENLEQSILFYSKLFGTEPTVHKPDYAKWMIEDPRINFAISTQSSSYGVNHLGLQVDSPFELETLRAQMKQADLALFDEGKTVCCYANSDKSWVTDPNGIAWETYHTMQEAALFKEPASATSNACCTPTAADASASACGSHCC